MIKELISERYWLQQFNNAELTKVNFGYNPDAALNKVGRGSVKIEIPSELIQRVEDFTRKSALGRFCYFITALDVLLYQYTFDQEFLIATSSFKNNDNYNPGNICFLKNKIAPTESIKDALNAHKVTLLECIKHQGFDCLSLIEKLKANNSQLDSSIFFQIGFVDQSVQATPAVLDQCELLVCTHFTKEKGHISFTFDDKFEKEFIEQFGKHYLHLLQSMLTGIHETIKSINILSELERKELLEETCSTIQQYPIQGLTKFFEAIVVSQPSFPAVKWRNEYLSYEELNSRANQLSNHLITSYDIKPGDVVCICLSSSFELLISVLGILKTGAAVLPIVPTDPRERVNHILSDSKAKLIVTDEDVFKIEEPSERNILFFNKSLEEISKQEIFNPGVFIDPLNAAYIIYTSGSTGKPKGVCLTHKNLCSFFSWFKDFFSLTQTDVLPQKTTISFVDSIIELLLPVTFVPSTVYLRPEDSINQDSKALVNWLSKIDTTIIQFVPSVFDHIHLTEDISKLKNLRTLILSGEAVKKNYPLDFDVYNLYGCSECTAVSTAGRLNGGTIHIGQPIANTKVYILSEDLTLVPKGAPGEILISGDGVSPGYFNNEALTAERFLKSPFNDEILYKTGDIGRMDAEGNIEYLGRKDQQVKIRGMRIELGEVERNLVQHEGIQEAVVLVKEHEGEKQLNAYLILKNKEKENEGLSYEGGIMDFSLFYFASQNADQYENKYQLLIDTAIYGDQNDFQAVWLPERHFHKFGGIFPDPAILCGALAVSTRQINLRAGSVVLPLHDELRVAEQWAVVDHLSKGRVSLSFASGWHADDFVFFPEDYMQRHKKMFGQIPVLQELWQGKKIERKNGFGKDIEVGIAIRPVQEKIPLWITSGGSKETFYNAGKIGANIITNLLALGIEDLAKSIEVYKKALRDHGHDVSKAKVTLMLHTYLGDDLETVKREVKEPFKEYLGASLGLISNLATSRGINLNEELNAELKDELLEMGFEKFWQTSAFLGTPESCEKLLRKLYAIGINEVACLIDFGIPPDKVMKSLELLTTLKDKIRKEDPATIRRKAAEALMESGLNGFYEKSLNSEEIKEFLNTRIPSYMIPSHVIFLKEFPQTSSSKIDRKALLDIDVNEDRNYVEPSNKTEAILAAIWSEILGKEKIGVRDKFTDLGGHSLRATRMISKIRKHFDVEIKLRDVFAYPTIEELAVKIYNSGKIKFQTIPLAGEKDYYDASNPQKRMWIFDESGVNPLAYNLLHNYLLRGELDGGAMDKAFFKLVERHESLRTTFQVIDGEIKQKIHPLEKFPFRIEHIFLNETVDLSKNHEHIKDVSRPVKNNNHDEKLLWAEAEKYIESEKITPFSLSEGPLLRVKILHLTKDNYLFILSFHHIISDGWSMNVFFKDLFTLYHLILGGQEDSLPPLPIQYKDYTEWHNQRINEEVSLQRDYWKKKLSGNIQPLNLPTDFSRPETRNYNGAHHRFSLSESVSNRLRSFNQKLDVTFFAHAVTLVKILLYKHTNQEDIVVGSPVSGRNHESLEGQIGLFLNNLVLRDQINPEENYIDLLLKVKNTILEAFENMDYPYDRLVDELGINTPSNKNPFYDVMVVADAHDVFAAPDMDNSQENPFHIQMVGHEAKVSKLDLTFFFVEMEEIKVDIEYSTELFEERTIKKISADFELLIEAVLNNPYLSIKGLKDLLKDQTEVTEHASWQNVVMEKLDDDF